MFSGIVEGIGIIREIGKVGESARIAVQPHFDMEETRKGESISVNGVCLTLVDTSKDLLAFDISPETILRTTFSILKVGHKVNLERSLRLSDRLGGHLVMGHIDGVGKILEKDILQDSTRMKIGVTKHIGRYLVEKGSIAVDGISLTINSCTASDFSVTIIPYTAEHTTIGMKKVGDSVNIEVDLIGKYVERLLKGYIPSEKEDINTDFLSRHGFV
jgi:riboflavin synthase